MKVSEVEFEADDGTVLRGNLFAPDGSSGRNPLIVMSHGFSGVKEQIQPFAEAFAQGGLAVLLYDHRNLGSSDGTFRGDIDPVQQIRDMRRAITHAQSLANVDPERIGLWGTSYSGGHVLAVAGIDKRVKCVVSQVPLISGIANLTRVLGAEKLSTFRDHLDEERRSRARGEAPKTIPVASLDPSEAVAFPGARTHYFVLGSELAKRAHNYRNECTLRSLDYLCEYDVSPFLKSISPAPLLMLVATVVDNTTPAEIALAAYATALEPKRALVLPGDHYSPYFLEEDFPLASSEALAWFTEHLLTRKATTLHDARAPRSA